MFTSSCIVGTVMGYRNVILWMDHRANQEMEEINSTGHSLLDYVGGKVSIEMQMPKILWIKRVSSNLTTQNRSDIVLLLVHKCILRICLKHGLMLEH